MAWKEQIIFGLSYHLEDLMWDEGEFRVLWWDFVELVKNMDFGGLGMITIATRASASPPDSINS